MYRNRLPWLLSIGLLSGCGGGAAASSEPNTPDLEHDSSESSPAECVGLEACKSECDEGKANSCEWLGHMHETGDGAPQNYDEAARYYDKACESGLDESCAHLAMMYDIGLAVEEDPEKASRLYEKACNAGNRWACKRGDELE